MEIYIKLYSISVFYLLFFWFESRFYHIHCVSKNGLFCFCYNFVSRDQIIVIFGSSAAKEIFNRTLLTDIKEIASALR